VLDAGGRVDSRRVIDLTLGPLALVVALPIMVGAAAAMRLSGDAGPFLYRAPRNGANGRAFTILKIRTMAPDATGPAITVAADRRITPVGRALRHFHIDELPQLFNVLRGEMSLVGPRPEHPDFIDLADPVHHRVFSARPGITGPAQLMFRDEAELLVGADADRAYRERILPAKVQLDDEYLASRTVWLDLRILIRTLLTALR
jgi:lipopolysaccharide/colanic/teichoic acid biosynthesis glycosyltransferase